MKQNLTIDEVISRLEAKGYSVKKTGDVYRSACPGHGGDGPNLAFTEGKNGQVVFKCHSKNCDYESIARALGIEKEMKPTKTKERASRSENTSNNKTVHATLEQASKAVSFGAGVDTRPNQVYKYNDERGRENLIVLRWDTETGKIIRPVTKVEDGYIVGTIKDRLYSLYNLSETCSKIIYGDSPCRIYVCEGEKAAQYGLALGLTVTTSAFGSQSATKSDWAILDRLAVEHGKKLEIVVLPDNDTPGREYADSLVNIFSKFKSEPVVKVVAIADNAHITGLQKFPEHGDLFDLWELLDGVSIHDIAAMIEKMADETVPEPLTACADEDDDGESDNADSIYPWHPFPVGLLPETVSRFVTEVGAANGCDPAGVSIAALVALATAVGNSRRLRLKHGWIFPGILWGMLIARKGSIKSWALAPAMEPLEQRQKEYHRRHKIEKAEYDRKRNEYMMLTPAQRRKAPPFDLKEPVLKRVLAKEATEQKLFKDCAENIRGFCLFSDELTTLLCGMGQYSKDGGNAQSLYNSLYNGQGIENERLGESRYAPLAFVTIIGGIQPGMARRCLDAKSFESGFASRFLLVAPPIKVAKWTRQVVSEEAESEYRRLIDALLDLEMEPQYGSPTVVSEWSPDGDTSVSVTTVPEFPEDYRPVLVEVSPEAEAEYAAFYDRTGIEMEELSDDNLRGAFEKIRTFVARIALVIHVTRAVEQRISRDEDPSVAPWSRKDGRINELECDLESMKVAVELGEWFKYETRRVYATWGGLTDETPRPKADGLQQRIVELLEQKCGTLSLRDIQRKLTVDKASVEDAAEGLLGIGLIERFDPPKGSRSPLVRLKSTHSNG